MNDNYPPMSQHEWNNASFNEKEPDEKEFKVTISQTLNKTVNVLTEDYNLEVVSEKHNGIYEETIDTSNTSWRDVYAENDLHTPSQLILLFRRYLDYLISGTPVPLATSFLESLKDECDNWTIDNEEFEQC